jgi:hypothetical protein
VIADALAELAKERRTPMGLVTLLQRERGWDRERIVQALERFQAVRQVFSAIQPGLNAPQPKGLYGEIGGIESAP